MCPLQGKHVFAISALITTRFDALCLPNSPNACAHILARHAGFKICVKVNRSSSQCGF